MSTVCSASRVPMNDVPVKTSTTLVIRSLLLRLALSAAIVLIFALLSRAGGPSQVAGTAYFSSTMTGQALTWPQGAITYFTDQGALSAAVSNASANSLVASAFSQWTSLPTAALTAASAGQLAEDVNGSNVTVNADGSISMPPDIQSSATGTPVGVVYDYDGSVTSALLGAGAGDPSQCFSNAVFGGDDNFSTLAAYQHALIVINGQCAQQSSQLTDIEYRLVRVIGTVLGVGWSQLNLNVITGSPHPTSADFAGFPVMHRIDSLICVPITRCYPTPYQLSSDDAAAVSRLYPVTAQNQSSFPGKNVFASVTARIHGSVWFTDDSGSPAQPMQGVNVVARWIDPSTGLPSRQYAVSSISGFLFSGNSGNPITGFDDDFGDPLCQWGSNQQTWEGFFDLAGLPLPNGESAQYQLSIEALDPEWSAGAGPYGLNQVAPSGSFRPITVTVSAGQDVEEDVRMLGSAQPIPQASAASWSDPAPVPTSGDWMASLSPYGNEQYFRLTAQANRTLSVAVTALDESGNASNSKAMPVIGMWDASLPEGTAPTSSTSSAFNSSVFGQTLLDAQINLPGSFLIGISDLRGDGRPDYHYHASVLYADSVSPARVGVNGGPVTVAGIGFAPGLTATVGSSNASLLAIAAGEIILSAPASADGLRDITISNTATAASTTMSGVLTYGAASTDNIVLLSKTNPSTPVGEQAVNPVSVQVVAADGVTPVAGVTVGWAATNGVQLSACGAVSSCSAITDESGGAATWLVPSATGAATITATLAPGVYSPAKSVSTTISASESTSDIGTLAPYLWVAQGATLNIPLTLRVMSNGAPSANATVNFNMPKGSGTLSAPSASTNASGYTTVTLSVVQFAALAQVNACVAPSNAPCQNIYVTPAPLNQLQLWQVAGAGQISASASLQPVVVRVTDFSSPPNSILGAPVLFQTTVFRPLESAPGGTNPVNPVTPVILSVSQNTVLTDVNGLASLTPSGGGFSPPLEVDVGITAGTSGALDDPLEILPALATGNGSSRIARPLGIRARVSPGPVGVTAR
ncbi:MAG TPA: Ig-like domain-containing protein [Verrucomicrobiae bacterium]|nr:Ig-like domain-containing protein [Verrucomicrobiae bacterium]